MEAKETGHDHRQPHARARAFDTAKRPSLKPE